MKKLLDTVKDALTTTIDALKESLIIAAFLAVALLIFITVLSVIVCSLWFLCNIFGIPFWIIAVVIAVVAVVGGFVLGVVDRG